MAKIRTVQKFENELSEERSNEMKHSLTSCMFSGVTGTSALIRVKKQQMPMRAVSGGLANKSLMILSPSTMPGYVCLQAEIKFKWLLLDEKRAL